MLTGRGHPRMTLISLTQLPSVWLFKIKRIFSLFPPSVAAGPVVLSSPAQLVAPVLVARGTLSITTTEIYFEVDEDDPAFKRADSKVGQPGVQFNAENLAFDIYSNWSINLWTIFFFIFVDQQPKCWRKKEKSARFALLLHILLLIFFVLNNHVFFPDVCSK